MTDAERGLTTTHHALSLVQEILLSLSSRRAEMHPFDFANQAQGAVEMIHKLRADIDHYVGMAAAELAITEVNALIAQNLPIPGLPRLAAPVAKAS